MLPSRISKNRINNQTNTEVQPKDGIPFAMDELSLEELFFALMQVYKKELFDPHFDHELQFSQITSKKRRHYML
jgi:hypothetical protein